MERCHSNLSLPQSFNETAKYNLVKIIPRSDGETNQFFAEDILAMGDQDFKSKRRKPNTLSKFIQELCCKGEGVVAPSTGNVVKRKLSRVPSQDDLWKSIETDYTFLMADDLITECQETRKELCFSPPHPPSSKTSSSESHEDIHHMLTFSEFLDHFNELHDKLHSLQTSSSKLSESKFEQLYNECQYLKQQAAVLKLMNPELRDDINRRSNILSNKLQLLEQLIFPKRVNEKDLVIKSLTSKMKEIRKWLQDVEGKLRKLKISDNTATEEMKEVFSREKILQREIEGRGKELTSIVRQCESLEGATVAESKKLRRASAHLERSWHNIWIRSLEKQCLTEQQLLERQTCENNHQEVSDLELDEGPLNKHRRLTLDRWTAVATATTMDRVRLDRDTLRCKDVIKNGLTKDVGVLCSDLIPVNDKCIMVGTTGIAALKAEYGDDFTNFEIIQDVGYSSESSTHLSSDDGISGNERYFNIRYNYNYAKTPSKCASLKEELEDADAKQPESLASSVGSSSGATSSFNDSGIGSAELLLAHNNAASEISSDKSPFEGLSRDLCENFVREVFGEDSDYLEAVLESCANFDASDGEKGAKGDNVAEDLQYRLSGIESDDASDNFHNRSSFTTSSQLFYKMISVESDNDDGEPRANDSTCRTLTDLPPPSDLELETSLETSHLVDHLIPPNPTFHNEKNTDTIPDPEQLTKCPKDTKQKSFKRSPLTTTMSTDKRPTVKNTTPNLKRKHDSDPAEFSTTTWQGGGRVPHRVRTWLKRSSNYTDTASLSRVKRCLFRNSSSGHSSCEESVQNLPPFEDPSSCDASGEYTSSSADEGNAPSFFDDDERRLSGGGSFETVLRGFCGAPGHQRADVDWIELPPMLPPPLSSTPACLRRGQCKEDRSDRSMPRAHCGDMRWLVLKASSEGDIRNRVAHSIGSEHSLTNIPTDVRHKKSIFESPTLEYKHRLCSSSLPNVLRHRSDSSADDAKTSQSEGKSSRRCILLDESPTSFVSHNQSSSSDLDKRKRRRNRRKSSSSNRSSRSVLTSCDSSRHRTRTLTSDRTRHFSQKSDFFEDTENDIIESVCEVPISEVTKTPIEEINHKTLKDELQLALAESCRSSATLLSPAESDVVLTHLEEQSTVSDQVWDGYQDNLYLSEAYSEPTVDEDAVRKLTEFGDDYGSAIGQPMRYLDTADGGKGKTDIPKSPPKKSSKAFIAVVQSNDSDSDREDLHHMIEESEKALHFARATLKRRQSGDFFSSTENAELLATCGTHLHCLQTIFIEIDGNESSFSSNDLEELHNLIQDWKDLKKSIAMYEDVDDTTTQKYIKARENIDILFKKIYELSVITEMDLKDIASWEELQDHISNLQMVLSTLQDTKELLLAVNLQVHRFMTEHSGNQEYRDCSLKEDVTELYQRWEDVYEKLRKGVYFFSFASKLLQYFDSTKTVAKRDELITTTATGTEVCRVTIVRQKLKSHESEFGNRSRNGAQLTESGTLSSRWKIYNDKFRILKSKVDEIQYNSSIEVDSCDKNNLSCEELRRTLQSDLKELKCSAEFLRDSSIGVVSWNSIQLDLNHLEHRIKRETRKLSVSRSTTHPNSSATEDDPDDDFEDAIQMLEKKDARENEKRLASPSPTKKDANLAKKSSASRFWRIVRVAVPVQLTLVLLFCLACYLEPNCCDRLNNFSYSLTPHLRYLRGPPPV